MDPSSRTIISRAITIIVVLIVAIWGFGIYKKIQRKADIVSQLKLETGQSSFSNSLPRKTRKKP